MLGGQNSIIAVFDLSWVRHQPATGLMQVNKPLSGLHSGLHSPQIQSHCRDVSSFMLLVAPITLGGLSLIEDMSECHVELLPMTTTTCG